MAQAINGKAQQRRDGTRRAGSRRAEDFVAKSEKHNIDAAAQTRAMDTAARAIARDEGIKFTICTFRGTEQQKELIKYAAKREKKVCSESWPKSSIFWKSATVKRCR